MSDEGAGSWVVYQGLQGIPRRLEPLQPEDEENDPRACQRHDDAESPLGKSGFPKFVSKEVDQPEANNEKGDDAHPLSSNGDDFSSGNWRCLISRVERHQTHPSILKREVARPRQQQGYNNTPTRFGSSPRHLVALIRRVRV